jgi:hypothetical protein
MENKADVNQAKQKARAIRRAFFTPAVLIAPLQ